MGLLQKEVVIKINQFNIEHYIEKGYGDIKKGDQITVKVEDLTHGSGAKIKVSCDYCGKIFYKPYRDYLRTKDKVCCNDCKQNKITETNLKKFGTTCAMANPTIHEKIRKKFQKKYGVDYPLQSDAIQEKCRNTFRERYNSNSYYLNSSEISRVIKEQNKNGFISSKEQDQLNEIYNGISNFKFGKYHVDIMFPENKICCEYNGGGHYLGVYHGRYSMEEKIHSDYLKYAYFVDSGYKCFVIENRKTGLPNSEKLLQIKERAFEILTKENDVFVYIYDIKNDTENLLKRNEL